MWGLDHAEGCACRRYLDGGGQMIVRAKCSVPICAAMARTGTEIAAKYLPEDAVDLVVAKEKASGSYAWKRYKVACQHFFYKFPQGFAEGSVKEYKRAETAKQARKPNPDSSTKLICPLEN
jgi:hypothetical protein